MAARVGATTLFLAIAVAFGMAPCAGAQTENRAPCYVFVRQQSLLVGRGGPVREVIVLPQPLRIWSFAVARNGSALAYAVLNMEWVTRRKALGYLRLHLVPLQPSGVERISIDWNGPDLYASCGTILASTKSHVRDFIREKRLKIKPYASFRCSSDSRTVAGWTKASALEAGVPPRRQLISSFGSRSSYFVVPYDVSPNGRYVAYMDRASLKGLNPAPGKLLPRDIGAVRVCVSDLESRTTCSTDRPASIAGRISVSDSGAVIFDGAPGKGSVGNGVVMWVPGAHSSTVLQTAGGSPQWLTPTAAASLLDWAKHNQADVK